MCIRLKKEERPLVKDLLNHEFFADDVGLKLEMVSRDSAVAEAELSRVEFRLRVLDPKKRSNKHKENEAIQFDFDIQEDNAEEVASEMAKSSLILEEDAKVVTKMLKSQITGLLREREERRMKEERERLDRESESTADNILQNNLLLQQMQIQQQQQVQSTLNIQVPSQVGLQAQIQVQGQQPQVHSTVQSNQQLNLQPQQVQMVHQQPLIQHQTSVAQPQQAQQLQQISNNSQQVQYQLQQQQQQQQLFETIGSSSSQCSTPQNVQPPPQFGQIPQHLQQQAQNYIQINAAHPLPHSSQIQPQLPGVQQQNLQNIHQQIQQNQQATQYTQAPLQHIQPIISNQGASSTSVQGQAFYQTAPSTTTVYSSPLFQQSTSQHLYHGFSSTPTSTALIDILPMQSNQQVFSHSTVANNNIDIPTSFAISHQPVISIPSNAQSSVTTFADINASQSPTINNVQSGTSSLPSSSQQSHNPNSLIQVKLPPHSTATLTAITVPSSKQTIIVEKHSDASHQTPEAYTESFNLLQADTIDSQPTDSSIISHQDTIILDGQQFVPITDGYVSQSFLCLTFRTHADPNTILNA